MTHSFNKVVTIILNCRQKNQLHITAEKILINGLINDLRIHVHDKDKNDYRVSYFIMHML